MKIIALTALAQTGKDTFCQVLIKELAKMGYTARRRALADTLKNELSGLLWDNFGIDIFDCTSEEKNLVRPLLVDYGKIKRQTSEGTYWWKLLEKKLDEVDGNIINIITDVRYAEYEKDEVFFVKKHDGILVHLSRDGITPPNKEEEKFDPILELMADYRFLLDTAEDKNKIEQQIQPLVEVFVKDLYRRNFLP
jgi:hypothetical protein